MSTPIKGKNALVTGANRGIGKAIVESLIKAGAAKVYLAVRNLDSTQPLVEAYGSKVQPLFVDVSQKSTIIELAQQAQDVNIVVNNAGILEIASALADNVEDAFTRELQVNVYGLIAMAKAFEPILEKNGGALVQINSVASIKNFSAFTSYSASKAAAYSFTQGIREQFLPKGIHVLSVHPGPISTDMGREAGLIEVSDDASKVSEGIVTALTNGDVHLFPDAVAKDFESAYGNYATNVVEPIEETA